MSVDADEHVLVRDGRGGPDDDDQRVRDPLVEGLPTEGPQRLVRSAYGGYGQVLSVGLAEREPRFGDIKGVVRHEVDEPLYEVKTLYGRSVRVTGSHSVYVHDEGELRKSGATRLQPGDLVVAPRRIPLPDCAPVAHRSSARAPPLSRSASQVWVRGPAVLDWDRQKITLEHAEIPSRQSPESRSRRRFARS